MTPSGRALALVALGGAAGASGRYWVAQVSPVAAGTFPTSTLAVNLAGAFLLGLLVETVVRHDRHAAWARPSEA